MSHKEVPNFLSSAEEIHPDAHSTPPSENRTIPTDKEIRQLTWKRDIRIIPLVFLFYLCSFLDRVNIGNAKLAGLTQDINMSEDEYNGALSIFFVGYILFEVPSNMMVNKVGPRLWIAVIQLVWGVIMMSMAAAGLVPAILFYLSIWYTRREQAKRIAIFFCCLAASGAVGGLLAFGIVRLDGVQNLAGWQWIFILEAIPTLVLSIVCYFALPDFPETTPFLNEHERGVLLDILKADAGPVSDKGSNISWDQFRVSFRDWLLYGYCIIALGVIVDIYSVGMFLPSIIYGMGFQALTAQAMTVPPYIIAGIFTVLNGFSASKREERGIHAIIPLLFAMLGFILLMALNDDKKNLPGLYFAAILITTGSFSAYGAIGPWFTNNFSGRTKRSVAVAFITCVGNVGGVIAGQIYRAEDSPHYRHGHLAAMIFCVVTVIGSLVMKTALIRINKKRDNMTAEERLEIIKNGDMSTLINRVI
ncbi:major facilitator superfamily domain-containing protein [Phascolomyces articulosus]|uniref:Major facilitator superfamily domain-containing protein n=1 Tax=Phascolomyces articulosus TaxID=60185 RepID=A0AAD5JZS3_9FUNG|nr:major facilitator superfamily domain-containing protein [Phascolomyces articulosus]